MKADYDMDSLEAVAPLAGAWIEILYPSVMHSKSGSLPSRERGLKLPSRYTLQFRSPVAPLAGAWIEINVFSPDATSSKSLPSRERGLKCSRLVSLRRGIRSLPSRERG